MNCCAKIFFFFALNYSGTNIYIYIYIHHRYIPQSHRFYQGGISHELSMFGVVAMTGVLVSLESCGFWMCWKCRRRLCVRNQKLKQWVGTYDCKLLYANIVTYHLSSWGWPTTNVDIGSHSPNPRYAIGLRGRVLVRVSSTSIYYAQNFCFSACRKCAFG